MSSETKGSQAYHARADHEDNLHVSRTNLFIGFNGFLAIAVGLRPDFLTKVCFIILALILDISWALWAPNARRLIRALRNAGGEREDEQVWKSTVGKREPFTALTIVSIYIPWSLTVFWLTLLFHAVLARS
jgi:hypothetical protein